MCASEIQKRASVYRILTMDEQQPGAVSWGFSNPNAKPLPPKPTKPRNRPAATKADRGAKISKVEVRISFGRSCCNINHLVIRKLILHTNRKILLTIQRRPQRRWPRRCRRRRRRRETRRVSSAESVNISCVVVEATQAQWTREKHTNHS